MDVKVILKCEKVFMTQTKRKHRVQNCIHIKIAIVKKEIGKTLEANPKLLTEWFF